MNQVENEHDYIDLESSDEEDKISLMSSVLLLAATIIGTGIFLTPGRVVKNIPSIFYSLLIWIACGIVSLLASLCYDELGLAYPSIGGEYTYFMKIYPDIIPFTYLITNFFLLRPVSIAMHVLFFARMVVMIVFGGPRSMCWICRTVSIVSLIFICTLNCLSERLTITFNNVLTYLKFGCMSVIIILGIYKLAKGEVENIKDLGFSIAPTASEISGAIYYGTWTYDGFNQLGYIVKKMKTPKKNLVKATVIGISVIIIFYFWINLSYFVLSGIDKLGNSSNIAKEAVEPYFSNYIVILTLLIALSALATANSFSYSGGNLYYDAAQRGHFPKLLAATHIKFKTYVPALIIQTFVTILFLLFSPNIDGLLTYFSAASWVYYSLVFAGVIISRYRYPNIDRPFKVWAFLPPVILAIGIFIVILGFVHDWFQALISIFIVLCTIPCYFLFVFKGGVIHSSFIRLFEHFTLILFNKFSLCDERFGKITKGGFTHY